jgi:hypothetical protein
MVFTQSIMIEESYKPYYGMIKDRCYKLIEMGIWHGIDKNKLDAWLKNFDEDKEKFFAACILDDFIYRSKEQTISMLYDLISRDLPNLMRVESSEIPDLLGALRNHRKDPSIRIVSATKEKDPPTKSGNQMCRFLQEIGINSKWTINPSQVRDSYDGGIRNFILVDDILASGKQITDTIKEWTFDKYEDTFFCIGVCVAHEEGLKKLYKEYPKFKAAYTELLLNEDSFFNSVDYIEFDLTSSEALGRYYAGIMDTKGVKNVDLLGFGSLGLLYAFEHNIPNNCMPIIYHESKSYKPLIRRLR